MRKNIVLMGAQGSGKGTQAKALVKAMGLVHISTGDMFRAAIAQQAPLGLKAKEYIDRGDLVPDELTIGLVLEELTKPSSMHGVILDGFPRNRDQARALDESLPKLGQQIDEAIYLDVPQVILMDRLMGRYICKSNPDHVYNTKTNPPKVAGICDIDQSELYQRSDDQPEKIQRRLDIFFTETIQVAHYYASQNKLLRVDGNAPMEEVSKTILQSLGIQIPNMA